MARILPTQCSMPAASSKPQTALSPTQPRAYRFLDHTPPAQRVPLLRLLRSADPEVSATHTIDWLHRRLSASLNAGEVSDDCHADIEALCVALRVHHRAAVELAAACVREEAAR